MGLFFTKKPIPGVEGKEEGHDKLGDDKHEEHINPRIDSETGLPKYGLITRDELNQAIRAVRREIGEEEAEAILGLTHGASDKDYGESTRGIRPKEYAEMIETLENEGPKYGFNPKHIAELKEIFNPRFK